MNIIINIKKELEQINRLKISRNFLSIEHNIGGVSGGSCWEDSDPKEYFNIDKRPDFESLYKLLEELVPNISFLNVRKIENELVKEFDYTDYEYYGNSTTNNVRYICLDDLYDFLYSKQLI